MTTEATVSARGMARIRMKPDSLLMMGKLKATGTTLELALIELRKQFDATSKWLERLNATEVEFGTPRFPDQVEPTALSVIQQKRTRRTSAVATSSKEVIAVYTAVFSVGEMSSDEVLILADRLRFESATAEESQAETQVNPVLSPVDVQRQVEEIMAQMSVGANDNDNSVRFMFRSRLSPEIEKKVTKEAFDSAHTQAMMLAETAGRKLGPLKGISQYGNSILEANISTSQIHRQTMMPELSETSYGMRQFEFSLSESPRPFEFSVNVHVTYNLI